MCSTCLFKLLNLAKTAKPTPPISSANPSALPAVPAPAPSAISQSSLPKSANLSPPPFSGKVTLQADSIELASALDFGGLAVLVDAWKSLNLDLLLADIGTLRQRALLKAMVFARLLFPCSKLALKDAAQGTLLAAACGLHADEDFDEDD